MLFDIAILNAEAFITGAFVRNFVFIDLRAFEVSNGNTLPCILYAYNKGTFNGNRRLFRGNFIKFFTVVTIIIVRMIFHSIQIIVNSLKCSNNSRK